MIYMISSKLLSMTRIMKQTLHWRHNDNDGVSNHQPHGCLLNRLFGRRSKKTSKLRVTGLCAGNSPYRWIPRTKGQWRGKCFHLMTSSWFIGLESVESVLKNIRNFLCSQSEHPKVWIPKILWPLSRWRIVPKHYIAYAVLRFLEWSKLL